MWIKNIYKVVPEGPSASNIILYNSHLHWQQNLPKKYVAQQKCAAFRTHPSYFAAASDKLEKLDWTHRSLANNIHVHHHVFQRKFDTTSSSNAHFGSRRWFKNEIAVSLLMLWRGCDPVHDENCQNFNQLSGDDMHACASMQSRHRTSAHEWACLCSVINLSNLSAQSRWLARRATKHAHIPSYGTNQ